MRRTAIWLLILAAWASAMWLALDDVRHEADALAVEEYAADIARMHRGELTVERRPGHARFALGLPPAKTDSAEATCLET